MNVRLPELCQVSWGHTWWLQPVQSQLGSQGTLYKPPCLYQL